MIDFLILGSAFLFALWASWPPRGERRRWLSVGLVTLWVALLLVGWRRGIQPGFGAWLVALAFIGALLALLVLWSVSNLLGRPHRSTGEERSKSARQNN
ncbi:MAG: hypothetical protein M3220_08310 [Chloroflexota bacterium]|nr:hypothetical protein [Chloroflexota bacterium]